MRPSAGTLLAAVVLVAATQTPAQPASGYRPLVSLELAQEFYYAGDPMNIRISVHNPGAEELPNPIRTPLARGLKVRLGDGMLEPAATDLQVATRPDKLAPQSFYGGVLDATQIFPRLREVGSYGIYWSADGVTSDMLLVQVIPRYDPSKQYLARLDTTAGAIEILLLSRESPLAVKSFVDMAHAGFYDGLPFHEVRTDSFIAGGDPRFASPPRASISFPTEQSALPVVAGTVAMKPVSAAPPANGSTFMIALKPQQSWTGQVTVVGQVLQGLDIVQNVSRVPSSMRTTQPFYKPLQDVIIRSVTIVEKPDPSGS